VCDYWILHQASSSRIHSSVLSKLYTSVDYQPDSQLAARIRLQMDQGSAADAIPGLRASVGVSS